jgi:hypothetical protein
MPPKRKRAPEISIVRNLTCLQVGADNKPILTKAKEPLFVNVHELSDGKIVTQEELVDCFDPVDLSKMFQERWDQDIQSKHEERIKAATEQWDSESLMERSECSFF